MAHLRVNRFGHITDKDVMKLNKVKTWLYPEIDYQKWRDIIQ